jgi:16S rRNA (cytosine1402-N4)-methyltransferase
MTQDREYHRPVLAGEVVELLSPVPPGVVIDATFGGGGHARRLLAAMSPDHRILGIDRDPAAVAQATDEGGRLLVVRGNFAHLADILTAEGITSPVGFLFDFGLSSHHVDDPARGFSYRHAGPLDMRMDPDQALTADRLVNELEPSELADLIRRLGEEPSADRIAAAIVRARPIHDTVSLATVIAEALPRRDRGRRAQRIHPARRTFQALRMAVNGELEAISAGIDQALELLVVEGRCVTIAYHSHEDRMVKERLAAAVGGCVCPPELPVCGCGASPRFRLLTRGATKPTLSEIERNPRARSARLRAVVKVAA